MTLVSFPKVGGATTDAQYAEFFSTFIGTGVRGASEFLVSADSSGLNVKVAGGLAVIAGCAAIESSAAPATLAIEPNATGAVRVDTVVLRRDFTAANVVTLVVKAGPGGSSGPALTQIVGGVWEEPLADVTVAAGAATITSANVADRRRLLPSNVQTWATTSRPVGRAGLLGLNTQAAKWEYHDGTAWRDLMAVKASAISDATALGRSLLTAVDADVVRGLLASSIGAVLLTASSAIAAREALRMFKGTGPATPQPDDLRYRDV